MGSKIDESLEPQQYFCGRPRRAHWASLGSADCGPRRFRYVEEHFVLRYRLVAFTLVSYCLLGSGPA